MKIGNSDLSTQEIEWCQRFSQDILNQATKQIISALNIRTKPEDVAVLLMELWTTEEEEKIEEPLHDEMSEEEEEDE